MDDSTMEELGRLRIRVFREFPYLYDGDEAYERDYLQRYREAPDALFTLITDDEGSLVGATTCLPIKHELAEFRDPFEQAGIDVAKVFYFGESVLLEPWRGRGIGKLFFDKREEHARELGYSITAFCAVERPCDHPLRPADYRPLDGFWQSRGYERHGELQATFPWREIGGSREIGHNMRFWLKSWD